MGKASGVGRVRVNAVGLDLFLSGIGVVWCMVNKPAAADSVACCRQMEAEYAVPLALPVLVCRFEIILRNIEAESPAVVEAAAKGLRRSGFVNYYGLQRFGSGAVATHR